MKEDESRFGINVYGEIQGKGKDVAARKKDEESFIINRKRGEEVAKETSAKKNNGLITDLSSLVEMEEFKEAWKAEFESRVAHNFHNRTQNKEAEEIVTSILRLQDIYNLGSLKTLASLAEENKKRDGICSVTSDVIRLSFAIGMIAINAFYEEKNEGAIPSLSRFVKYAPIVAQPLLTIPASFYGYQAAITRHLSNELVNAFGAVVDDFIKKSHINQITQGASSSNTQANVLGNHYQSFASLPRNFGTALNLLSMTSNLPRLMIEFFPHSVPWLKFNKYAGSCFAISGSVFSPIGKYSSYIAANSSKDKVKSKIYQIYENFDQNKIKITEKQAKEILEDLASDYKKNTKEPNFFSYLKLRINSVKDSLYGASYNAYKALQDRKAPKNNPSSEYQTNNLATEHDNPINPLKSMKTTSNIGNNPSNILQEPTGTNFALNENIKSNQIS